MTERRSRVPPPVVRQTPTSVTTELQLRLVIKVPGETRRDPRRLTDLLPLLAVNNPANGAETNTLPLIRPELPTS